MEVEPQPSLTINLDFGPFMEAMAKLGAAYIKAAGEAFGAFNAAFSTAFPRDPHHPPKLCIDGHEYRRRQRRRSKRK